MNIQERIFALRKLMTKEKIDVYIVPSADFHQSEYVGDYFKCRAFITGFTGSAGTAIFTQTDAALWTDGRYFIQAEKELKDSGIRLYKSGNPGVPTIEEYLDDVLSQNSTLGFDGRVCSATQGNHYKERFADKQITLITECDLIHDIWTDSPTLSLNKAFFLEEKYSGESTASKLSKLRQVMSKNNATSHLLSSLDDIAWLLNIRGRDVSYTPVVLCYAFITTHTVHLFIDEQKIDSKIKEEFKKNDIFIHPYNDIYSFIKELNENETILLDTTQLNYALYNNLPSSIKIIDTKNPTMIFKAQKNEVEISNLRKAHLKFMHWVKTHFDKEIITELSASRKLEEFRTQQEDFLWPSFEPISAFGAHAAMCHYSSSEETDVQLTSGFLYLTDTGGNYLNGSTDITRTVALGEIDSELKTHFTNALRGNLALSRIQFLHGCTGENLDILARQYLWNLGLDYKHGTGHGVGYLLSIHEGPCNIRWQYRQTPTVLEEGMVVTDEPGIYIENSHGIRLENELLVRKSFENEYGQFMHFEILTYVPFDLDAIDISLLQQDEKDQLNAYHKKVYDMVSPYLTKQEKEWLKVYTRPI